MSPPRPPVDVPELRATLRTHARAVIARDGVEGLTMRALAAEAGTAVGQSYKAFESRNDLLRDLAWESLGELARQLDDWAARRGGKLADRLMEFFDVLVASDAPGLAAHLARDSHGGELLRQAVEAGLTRSWAAVMTDYLRSRQRDGEVRRDVDVEAFGFMLSAALHYVMVTDEPFPAPSRATLAQHVAGVVEAIVSDRGQARPTEAG